VVADITARRRAAAAKACVVVAQAPAVLRAATAPLEIEALVETVRPVAMARRILSGAADPVAMVLAIPIGEIVGPATTGRVAVLVPMVRVQTARRLVLLDHRELKTSRMTRFNALRSDPAPRPSTQRGAGFCFARGRLCRM
jgi:hypothetical protein